MLQLWQIGTQSSRVLEWQQNTTLQLMIAFPIDDPKATEAIKRQAKKLVSIYVECFELSVEFFGKRATFFRKFQ